MLQTLCFVSSHWVLSHWVNLLTLEQNLIITSEQIGVSTSNDAFGHCCNKHFSKAGSLCRSSFFLFFLKALHFLLYVVALSEKFVIKVFTNSLLWIFCSGFIGQLLQPPTFLCLKDGALATPNSLRNCFKEL